MENTTWNNIGSYERSIRVMLGFAIVIASLAIPFQPSELAKLYLFDFYLLLTALIGYEPLYALYEAAKHSIFVVATHEEKHA